MGWLYFIASMIGAAFTANAFWPLKRPAPLAFVSFFAGWLTIELPLHQLAWQLLATWVWYEAGALDTLGGQLGLAVSAVSWTGLLMLFAQAFTTSRRIDDAVAAAYGTPAPPPRPRDRVDPLRVVAPFRIHRRDVTRQRGLQYRRVNGLDLKLDVYRHVSLPTDAPVLLHAHGGGWVIGSKNHQGLPFLNYIASRGWTAVNVNYRLSPHATFPEQLIDLKHAIGWVRDNIEAHGGRPGFLLIAGLSAGAHLASLAALTPNDPALQPDLEGVDTRVDGCISMYGVYDVLDRDRLWPHDDMRRLWHEQIIKAAPDEAPDTWAKACPVDCVGPHAPPFLIVHGGADAMVPVAGARRFAEVLRAAAPGTPIALAELPWTEHAFDVFPSVRTNLANQAIARFAEGLCDAHDPSWRRR